MEELLQKARLKTVDSSKPIKENFRSSQNERLRKSEKENITDQLSDLPKASKPNSFRRAPKQSKATKPQLVDSDSNEETDEVKNDKRNSELESGSAVFVMNNFLGYYSPAKVINRLNPTSECYNICFYNGEVQVCHRKYILTNRDPKFYAAKVEPIEDVKKVLDPELTAKDWNRIIGVVEEHQEALKDIILGKAESIRDHIYLFDHLKRSCLFAMSRPSPFRQSEFTFLCKYLTLDFIDDCQKADPSFKDAVAARFASAGHSLNMTMPNYSLLVLAPELLIRVILKQFKQLKTLEEAADFYLDHAFETETSYVALMYASREMYRYSFSESKSK